MDRTQTSTICHKYIEDVLMGRMDRNVCPFLFSIFNTIFISSHMHLEDIEGPKKDSVRIGCDIYPTLPRLELATCLIRHKRTPIPLGHSDSNKETKSHTTCFMKSKQSINCYIVNRRIGTDLPFMSYPNGAVFIFSF